MVLGCSMCLERHEAYELYLVLTYAIERKPINMSDSRLRVMRTKMSRFLECHPHNGMSREEQMAALESDATVIANNVPSFPKE